MISKTFQIFHWSLVVSTIFLTYNFVDCKYPEETMNISEIIRYNGYPCEDHEVITNDSYILSMQRIPYGRKRGASNSSRPVVLLQHGLLDSSHTWAINGPQESLAFILADNGYDVWLANSRGSTYSTKHVWLKPDEPLFWDFSWDEMARFDLPAEVGYALRISKAASLSYIGHSQGTQIMFARISQDEWLRQRVISYVALAPVAFLKHVDAGLKVLARFREELEALLKILGHGRVMSNSPIFRFLASTLCTKKGVPKICSEIIFMIVGTDTKNLNESRLPIYISHTPAGTSVKNLIHYAQSVNSGNFEMYDYGIIDNVKYYGTPTPPKYFVKNVGIPTAVFSGGNDTLADPTDVAKLLSFLTTDKKFYKQIPYYNHMDFVWGDNAYKMIYPDVLSFLKQYQ